LNYDGTILAVSHDRYFLNRICTKIYEVNHNCVNVFLGNYDYYYEKLQEQKKIEHELKEENTQSKTKTQLKEERRREKERLAMINKEKKNLQNLESDIASLEERVHFLELEMCKEEIYTDHSKSSEISDEINSIKNKLEKLYGDWENSIKKI